MYFYFELDKFHPFYSSFPNFDAIKIYNFNQYANLYKLLQDKTKNIEKLYKNISTTANANSILHSEEYQ